MIQSIRQQQEAEARSFQQAAQRAATARFQPPVVNPAAQARSTAVQGLNGARALGNGFAGLMQDRPNVAVIDDFANGQQSHGAGIARIIENGGSRTDRYDISRGDRGANIANALGSVLSRVRSGRQVDAVNLSQQNFQVDGSTALVRQRIAQLQALGVPVVVAAGNGGANTRNQLGVGAAYVVENATANGQRAASSGLGNVRAPGEFTSQAAAVVSSQVAARHRAATVGNPNGLSAPGGAVLQQLIGLLAQMRG